MPTMDTMKDRIRIARLERGLTQEAVGTAVGVSRVSALNWENKNKKNLPERHRLPRLAEVLGVRLDWLMAGTGPMSDAPEPAPIPGGAMDRALLYRVVVSLEAYLEEHELKMSPEDKGETLLAVYDWAEAEGGPEHIDIRRIASLLRRLTGTSRSPPHIRRQ